MEATAAAWARPEVRRRGRRPRRRSRSASIPGAGTEGGNRLGGQQPRQAGLHSKSIQHQLIGSRNSSGRSCGAASGKWLERWGSLDYTRALCTVQCGNIRHGVRWGAVICCGGSPPVNSDLNTTAAVQEERGIATKEGRGVGDSPGCLSSTRQLACRLTVSRWLSFA